MKKYLFLGENSIFDELVLTFKTDEEAIEQARKHEVECYRLGRFRTTQIYDPYDCFMCELATNSQDNDNIDFLEYVE